MSDTGGELVDLEAGDPDAGDLEDGVTKRWRPHQHTQRRANDLGVDLRRWPLEEPQPGWQDDAVCRRAPSEVANAMGDLLSQAQATELVTRWCQECPVRQACFETGRALKGHGLWGGVVLREGRVATWRTAAERSRRARDTETTKLVSSENILPIATETTELVSSEPTELVSSEPTEQHRRGQRPQPRKFSRAARRSRRKGRAVR